VAAADRPMGGVPDRPASERKGARLCDLRRTATVPQRFGSRQYRRVKPQSVKVRRVRGDRYGKESSRTLPPRKRGKWRPQPRHVRSKIKEPRSWDGSHAHGVMRFSFSQSIILAEHDIYSGAVAFE